MVLVACALLLTLTVLAFTLLVRARDLPAPTAVSPTLYLEERKATIYEGLRDLNFEYRVGKLSDEDYQQTKTDLQRELAGVLAEIDRVNATPAVAAPAAKPKPAKAGTLCPHCGAKFEKPLRFCGECGKSMAA